MNGLEDAPTPPRQRWRTVGWVGVGVEAAALAVASVAYGVHAFSLPEPAFAVGLSAFAAVVAMGLAAAARGLARGARWAVSAALTWQALQVLAGINLTGVRPGFGIPVAVLAAVVGIAVVLGARDALRPAS